MKIYTKKEHFEVNLCQALLNKPLDSLIDPKDVKDETGKQMSTSDYELSGDKKRIIFFNGREPIYRRSSKANLYLYDVATKKTIRLE